MGITMQRTVSAWYGNIWLSQDINTNTEGIGMNVIERNENLARDIHSWLVEKELWHGCTLYFNGKAWSYYNNWNNVECVKTSDETYEFDNKWAEDYLEFGNNRTVTLSFEGSDLYDIIGDFGYYFPETYQEFGDLFKKYGMFYELGDSWYCAAYED